MANSNYEELFQSDLLCFEKLHSGSWQFYNEGTIPNQTLCLADYVAASTHAEMIFRLCSQKSREKSPVFDLN